MYKKLLFSSLASLSLITPFARNIAEASSISNYQTKSVCSANESLKGNKTHNLLQNFNFSHHLDFKVSGSQIVARFAPHNKQDQALELDSLAAKLGYKRFDWVNYVEQDPYGIADYQGQLLSLPYNDPPLGGYQYETADDHPFYWDIEQCENCRSRHYYQHPKIKQKFALTFEDNPSDYRLKPGETIEFVTHLVGVKIDRTDKERSQWDVLSTFKWQLTNNAVGRGQVSLTAVNLNVLELSPATLTLIKNDGGQLPITRTAYRDKDNHHNLQCQL